MAGDNNDNDSNQEELKQLIQKRGQIKAALTRFKTFFDSFQDNGSLTELKNRLKRVEKCMTEYEAIQSQVELLDNSGAHESDRDTFEPLYYEITSQAEDFIQGNTPSLQNPLTPDNSPITNNTSNDTPQVRLPSISLPTFSGNYEDWISFSDSFTALIHDNKTLNDIQKLHYLKSSIKNEAAQVINSLELSATNYTVAWKLLENRYKNLRLIVERHVKALFDLSTIEKESPMTLRQLLDSTLTHMRALGALEQPTDHWDTLIVHLVKTRLPSTTYREWENSTVFNELPKLNHLTDFLERRCHILENSSKQYNTSRPINNVTQTKRSTKQNCFVSQEAVCRFCQGKHTIYKCEKLLTTPHEDRIQVLKQAGICFNCLRPGHTVTQCTLGGCKKCKRKHNTLLHLANAPSNKQSSSDQVSCHSSSSFKNSQVLLSTAIVDVIGPHGHTIQCRALLDNGSQSSFLTETVAQQLCLTRKRQSVTVSGINGNQINAHSSVQVTLRSRVSSYTTGIHCLVVPKITGPIPADTINIQKLKIPHTVILADPTFYSPGPIDMLIGQELFFDLLCIGQIRCNGLPTIQKTRLGWIVGGRYSADKPVSTSVCHLSVTDRIDKQLQAFWELEEPTTKLHLTSDEKRCEDHFLAHTKRDVNGKYIVSMPFKEDPRGLGESRQMALKRFEQVEKRLTRNPELRLQYTNFMTEYINLGHMDQVESEQQQEGLAIQLEYYLPHHPVIKEDSSTTKLRVVFDASARTSTGRSLNDMQLVGPVVQSDLFSIILRFRMHTFVMTADLEKMYRQISVDQSQRDLLKIVWRDDPSQSIKTFRLNTVTYGTTSAPYLATRTLKQLTIDEGAMFPEASQVVNRDFYVDDVLTGTNTIEEGLELQQQLIDLLSKGNFNLRKWNSNSSELLSHLPHNLLERKPQEFAESSDSTKKTLGLWWDAEEDEFHFRHTPSTKVSVHRLSKRTVLSEIARLFDPLGLVAPVIIRAKIHLQELWKLKVSWDESLPMQFHTKWRQFLVCLNDLNHVVVKRQATLSDTEATFEMHGFSDASEKAYGAAVYLRHSDGKGNVKVSLLCAKSRVAPLKTVSLPRLELCAALILSELTNQVRHALQICSNKITYWTDSTVVLAWLREEPARWTTFVANRVSKIQEATCQGNWRHVATTENPADLISRGARTKDISDCNLWWEGPSWLKDDIQYWPHNTMTTNMTEPLPEERSTRLSSHVCSNRSESDLTDHLTNKYSSFRKIIRILSYCRRFVKNLKTEEKYRMTGPLTMEEINATNVFFLRRIQEQEFSREVKVLKDGGGKSTLKTVGNSLMSLSPFLSKDGLIRVGGRLDKSNLSYDGRHQVILPKNHKVTEMIATEEHIRQLHCGPQALLYAIRQQYWPINGRCLTRKITHQCVRCFRAKPKLNEQLMGDLPASRVTQSRPFQHTGVDYCGPFHVKHSKRRGARTTKAYVAVFICLATKAVHIELVSDLTTESFLAAMRRFISRRGICAKMISDNGKTFVGAKRELRELREFLKAEAPEITHQTSLEGIEWSFNPPYAPHMGGLWEAAVKSLKHHLKRIVGTACLTFEELATILTQVEAVLNSRPLTPISNDPSDLSVLTPAHFLTGGSLTALPEPSLMLSPENRLSRWQRVQQLTQHFWSRWSKEYLNNLQQRKKWKVPRSAVAEGSVVVLKEDNSPPLSWPLGRVIHLHPGRDGLTRVATIKTLSGEVKRCVNKLCPLPIDN